VELGLWSRAIATLKQASALDPARAEVFYELGKALNLAKNPHEAKAALQRSMTLDPNAASTHYQMARALEQLGDSSGARQELQLFERLNRATVQTGGMASARNQ
jgi:predicted Zn-dependent protease